MLRGRHLRVREKGAVELVRRSAEKGPRSWQSRTAAVFLSPPGLEALRLHEITLLEDTLDRKFTVDYPIKLIGDRAYESDKHDAWIKEQYGTQLIAPHNPRRKTKTQDGRPLRRYKRRWKVERLFAWLQNFRRIITRWERRLANYNAFVHLGCILILLRHIPGKS